MQRYLTIKKRLLEEGAFCPYALYICYGIAETGYPFPHVAEQLGAYLGVGRSIIMTVLEDAARGEAPQPLCEKIVKEVLENESGVSFRERGGAGAFRIDGAEQARHADGPCDGPPGGRCSGPEAGPSEAPFLGNGAEDREEEAGWYTGAPAI